MWKPFLVVLLFAALLGGCVSTDNLEQSLNTKLDEMRQPLDKIEGHMQAIALHSEQMAEHLKLLANLQQTLEALGVRLEAALQSSSTGYQAELQAIGDHIERLSEELTAARRLAEQVLERRN